MPCEPDELKHVPLFELFDDEELAVLAAQVEMKRFAPRQRIYKIGDPARQAYVVMSGNVRVTTVDEDQQEVLVDEPAHGGSSASPPCSTRHPSDQRHGHRRDRLPRVDRARHRRPAAAQAHGRPRHAHRPRPPVPRFAAARPSPRRRNANEIIEEEATFGERIADAVARFGGSWTFIITFESSWSSTPSSTSSEAAGLGSLPVHPAQSVPLHARRHPGAGDHDEPEPPGHQGPPAQRTRLRRQPPRGIRDPGLSRKLNLIVDKIGDVEDLVRANPGLATGPTHSTANS